MKQRNDSMSSAQLSFVHFPLKFERIFSSKFTFCSATISIMPSVISFYFAINCINCVNWKFVRLKLLWCDSDTVFFRRFHDKKQHFASFRLNASNFMEILIFFPHIWWNNIFLKLFPLKTILISGLLFSFYSDFRMLHPQHAVLRTSIIVFESRRRKKRCEEMRRHMSFKFPHALYAISLVPIIHI